MIELMVTLAVAAILLTAGVPSLKSFIQNNRAISQINQLVIAMNVARSEAVKRGSRISVCASANQTSCSGNADWSTGWIIFTDNAGTAGVKDAADNIIRVQEQLSGSTSLTSTSGDSFVQYFGTGRISDTSSVTFNLSLPGCSGLNVRNLSISPLGRVIQQPPTACP